MQLGRSNARSVVSMFDIGPSSNRNLDVRSWPYWVDCGPDFINMKLNARPRCSQQNHDRPLRADEVLLVAEILIRRD